MHKLNRWVLLEHTDDPNDPFGKHFDLLLEDDLACRTWRLDAIPVLNGSRIRALPLPFHKLEWLEKKNAPVSGGRGWAKHVFSGFFSGELPSSPIGSISITLHSSALEGSLEIKNDLCSLSSNCNF